MRLIYYPLFQDEMSGLSEEEERRITESLNTVGLPPVYLPSPGPLPPPLPPPQLPKQSVYVSKSMSSFHQRLLESSPSMPRASLSSSTVPLCFNNKDFLSNNQRKCVQ